ncbi:hypothetical protein V8E53_004826 [Lactarius tabidus]
MMVLKRLGRWGGGVVMGEAQMCTQGAEINNRLTVAPLSWGLVHAARVWVTAGCGAEPGSRVKGVFRPPGEDERVAATSEGGQSRTLLELPRRTLSSGLSPVFHSIGTLQTPLRTMLAPANSELPRGDGWVTSGLRAVFHKGKVVVRGREGMSQVRVYMGVALKKIDLVWRPSNAHLRMGMNQGMNKSEKRERNMCAKSFALANPHHSLGGSAKPKHVR